MIGKLIRSYAPSDTPSVQPTFKATALGVRATATDRLVVLLASANSMSAVLEQTMCCFIDLVNSSITITVTVGVFGGVTVLSVPQTV